MPVLRTLGLGRVQLRFLMKCAHLHPIVDIQARNTIENVIYTSKMLRASPFELQEVVVVTSDYHMERARRIFEAIFRPVFPSVVLMCAPHEAPISAEQRAREVSVEDWCLGKLRQDLEACCKWHNVPLA
jgi:hypothetical protein